MPLTADEAIELIKKDLWPKLRDERARIAKIDGWFRWDHDKPSMPRRATNEYKELAERSQAPWGRRVVTAVTDQLYVEGYRPTASTENSKPWNIWQANGLDARQIPIHEAAFAYGLSYTMVLPGKSFTGDKIPVIRGLDPSQMITVYEDPAWDDWPRYALRVKTTKRDNADSYRFQLLDDTNIYRVDATTDVDRLEFVDIAPHGSAGTCPVVRFANRLDLRGRADGEIEPFIPLLGRIDQTTFDRLIVQRFASWVVRTVSGMAPPDVLEDETEQQWRDRVAMMLRVSDLLAADDADTKFGSLPATPLDGFIAAHDADVRSLAAVSQTPVHELLAQMSNLSAESLAAAEASLTRKVEARKHTLGESWEQTLRLAALVDADLESAKDVSSQVSWKDMESRSLAQAADALGKLATMLGVPVELLWHKIPGFTEQDVEAAKSIIEKGGGIDALVRKLIDQQTAPPPPGG